MESGEGTQQIDVPEAGIIHSVTLFYTVGLFNLIVSDGYRLALSLSGANQITLVKSGGTFQQVRELQLVVLYT